MLLQIFPLLAQSQSSAMTAQLMLIGGIFLVMYFFMIRPQAQRAKESQTYIGSLKVGDHVVMLGGLHGKISKLHTDNTTMTIEIAPGTNVTVERAMISVDFTKALNTAKVEKV